MERRMFRLVRAGLFEFRKRRTPYVLLLVILAYMGYMISLNYSSAASVFVDHPYFSYSDFAQAAAQLEEGETEVILTYQTHNEENMPSITRIGMPVWRFDRVILPEAMNSNLGYMNIMPVLIVILAAIAVGDEYRMGTWRQTLAKGATRTQLMGSKFLLLLVTILAFVLVVTLLGFIASFITTWLITDAISWDFLTAGFAASLGVNIARILLMMLVYGCISAFFACLFRSSMAGVIAGLALFLIEGSIVMVLSTGSPPDWLGYTIGYNVQYFWNLVSPPLVSTGATQEWFTTWQQATGVLGLGSIVFTIATLYVFRRQDITSG